ncbi:hypothetical protein AB0J38_40305, partial [Streptomyces sp. NPDC050095]
WRRVPELSDLWGTAGPPSKEIRCHMAAPKGARGTARPATTAQQPTIRRTLTASRRTKGSGTRKTPRPPGPARSPHLPP